MPRGSIRRSLRGGVTWVVTVMLSACAPVVPVGGPRNEDPVQVEKPEGGDGNLFVDSVDIMILESFPVQAQAVIQGNLPDGCTEIVDVRVNREDGANLFEVTVVTHRDPEMMCTMALVPFEEVVSLDVDGLPAGTYTVDVHGETATFELAVDNVLDTE